MRTHRRLWLIGPLALSVAAGCTKPHPTSDAERRMLALVMPSRVEIVDPFTRVKSFDDDATPDGIELLLQAVNSLDAPGLMIVGNVRTELFEHIQASADSRGKRLAHWNIDLTTDKQQRRHWNPLTQMYEFRLGIDRSIAPVDDAKFVLHVTYTTPLGDHLTDQKVITYHRAAGPFGGA